MVRGHCLLMCRTRRAKGEEGNHEINGSICSGGVGVPRSPLPLCSISTDSKHQDPNPGLDPDKDLKTNKDTGTPKKRLRSQLGERTPHSLYHRRKHQCAADNSHEVNTD